MEVDVLIQKAENLIAADASGTSDPYCVVSLPPNATTKYTQIIWKTLHPNWNVTLKFEVADFTEVHVLVFDKDLKGSDYLGEVQISKHTIMQTPQGEWKEFVLSLQGNEKNHPGFVATGTIHLSVWWKPIELDENQEEIERAPIGKGKKEKADLTKEAPFTIEKISNPVCLPEIVARNLENEQGHIQQGEEPDANSIYLPIRNVIKGNSRMLALRTGHQYTLEQSERKFFAILQWSSNTQQYSKDQLHLNVSCIVVNHKGKCSFVNYSHKGFYGVLVDNDAEKDDAEILAIDLDALLPTDTLIFCVHPVSNMKLTAYDSVSLSFGKEKTELYFLQVNLPLEAYKGASLARVSYDRSINQWNVLALNTYLDGLTVDSTVHYDCFVSNLLQPTPELFPLNMDVSITVLQDKCNASDAPGLCCSIKGRPFIRTRTFSAEVYKNLVVNQTLVFSFPGVKRRIFLHSHDSPWFEVQFLKKGKEVEKMKYSFEKVILPKINKATYETEPITTSNSLTKYVISFRFYGKKV